MDINWIFGLLVVFQLKHFLGDFPLQGEYMLHKVSGDWSFLMPLSLHCLVHGAMTLGIVLAIDLRLWWLAPLDFVVHFIMDRIKSGPHYLGRYHDKSRPAFWNILGIDQMVHHLTGFYIVWVIINYKNVV